MRQERDSRELFALARRYAWVSLVAILITAIALATLYRELSIRTILEFGEQSNVTVADTTWTAMLREMTGFLEAHGSVTATVTIETVPEELLSLIRTSVRNTPIERVKIYNRNGILLYSTREQEIGTNDSANPRFQGAIGGRVRSQLFYRDPLSFFADATGDDNLIETYVPIRRPGNPQPVGVFEIYTDVDPIVRAMSHNGLLVLTGIAVILVALYSFLLYVVRRAEKIINDQDQTILERNQILRILSERMLHAEEVERRRVAWELHEDIAQTLSAVKVKIDTLVSAASHSQTPSGTTGSGEIVPLLQAAIGDVRALAMDLHPPDLDDFGLIATTRSLCREAEQVRDRLEITADLAAREEEIPDLLKSVIFRITQQTLKRLMGMAGIGDIRVALKKEEGLQLSIDFRAETRETDDGDRPASPSEERPITDFWERAVLSGGSFRTSHTDSGRFLYQATWMV